MTYQAYRIIIQIDDDATEFAVPETIVERIESTLVMEVRGIQLLGTPKTKLREQVASLEQKVRDLEGRLDRTVLAYNEHIHHEAAHAHSVVDVGEIVDHRLVLLDIPDRLAELERRFGGLRDDHAGGIRGLTSKPVTP